MRIEVNFKVPAGIFRFFTFVSEVEGDIIVDTHIFDEALENCEEYNSDTELLIYDYGKYLKYLDEIYNTSSYLEFKNKYESKTVAFNYIDSLSSYLGTEEDDTINGSLSADLIFGDNGDDIINAGNGNDIIYGEYGDDILNGGDGDDTYFFGYNHGNDTVNDDSGLTRIVFCRRHI